MRKIQLDIVALSHSVTQSANYAVVLGERKGSRRLPIVIGSFEAQAIAVAIEQMLPNRPLTHDLFKNVLDTYEIDLQEVIINNLLDGIFYAKLICMRNGEKQEIDSRTSDAIAMAVRFNCPIYTFDFILDAAGVVLDDGDNSGESSPRPVENRPDRQESLENMPTDSLRTLLEDVLAHEDYEKAALIRDELKRRES